MKETLSIISAGPLPEDPAQALPEEGGEAVEASELRPFRIDAALHGQRLDRALAVLVPEFSRSYLQQLVEAGAVQVQGRVVRKPSTAVRAGESGSVELRPTPQSQAFRPEPMALEVVHEDAHLLVLDKPAGLVVHPAPGHWSGTLLNGLLARDGAAARLPRAGIVHRLDRDTSGLMVVARTREAMEALVRMIAAREVTRQYVALGHGRWSGPAARQVDAPIGRDPRNRLRMAVVDLRQHAGKPARTLIESLGGTDELCLVRCTLETGRTHQIRVHMASIGHPLVGDEVYGGRPVDGLARQALHAWQLAFVHPVTGEAMRWRRPPPADLAALLRSRGLDYNRA